MSMGEQRNSDDAGDAPAVVAPPQAPPVRGGAAARRQLEKGVVTLFRWTLRLLVIAAGLWLIGWLIGQLWSIVLPVALALLLSTVLWPPVRFMRRKLPPALAAV